MSRQAIFVLGMHRSGTSALAGVLAALGVTMPKTLMSAHATNPKGFFESYVVMNLSDEMLRAAGGAWDDWRAIDLAHLDSAEYEARIFDVFHHEFGDDPALIAVKDPRHCRMAPLWLGAAEKLGYKPLAILPYRHPLEVAESLAARDDMPVAQGLLIWLRHVLDAEYFTRDRPRAFVYMPDLLNDWRSSLDAIAGRLDIEWRLSLDDKTEEIDHFLDRDLKNHTVPAGTLGTDPTTSGWVMRTFTAMQALVVDPAAADVLAELDAVRAEFDLASALFGPALAGLEVRNRKLEQQRTADAAEAGEQRAALERLRLEADNRTIENRALVARLSAETSHVESLWEKLRRMDGLNHEAEVLRARVAALDNDVFHLHAGLVAAETHRRQLDDQQYVLKDAAAAAEEKARILEGALAAAEEKIQRIEQTVAAQAGELEALASILSKVSKVRDRLVADLEKSVQAHEEAVQASSLQIRSLRHELHVTQDQLKAYRDARPMQHLTWALGRARP